ncbi:hypothetical protein HPP92_016197 [Vanilla planifolia]|uniref:Uncharacterized protein n=1 Tax=Vanilla planifolia TaxID=51239 RepID=A0A835QEC1_VANPL|nr:hypothetical protein HPP92_016197 [Vanilla planifolia]
MSLYRSWLRAHLNCPLCRTQIASASSAAYPISDGDGALINSATEWNAQTSDQRNSEEEEEDGERFIETVAVTGFSTDYTSSSASSCGGICMKMDCFSSWNATPWVQLWEEISLSV